MNFRFIESNSSHNITPAVEDYVEAIFNLAREKGAIRVRDIAQKLGVKMPTVSNMLKTLCQKGIIDYEKYEYVELTKKGIVIGKEVDRRHRTLKTFLTDILQLEDELADKEACRMEHAVSLKTLERIIDFMQFIEYCPGKGGDWLSCFDEFRKQGQTKNRVKCLEHIKKLVTEYGNKIKKLEGRK